MIDRVKRFISAAILSGTFNSRDEAWRFAKRVGVIIAFTAGTLTIIAHLVLEAIGALPYPMIPAATVGTIIAVILGMGLGCGISYICGVAICDLSISRETFERLSRTDMLSGLLNRRAFLDTMATATENSSLLLLDIDRFKAINDRYGHDAGDQVIISVAEALTTLFGADHQTARIGGEEFAVLIREMTPTARLALASQAREMIAAQRITIGNGSVSATVSGGVAEHADHPTFSALFAAADKALYIAKASGRNRVVHDRDLPKDIVRERMDHGERAQPAA